MTSLQVLEVTENVLSRLTIWSNTEQGITNLPRPVVLDPAVEEDLYFIRRLVKVLCLEVIPHLDFSETVGEELTLDSTGFPEEEGSQCLLNVPDVLLHLHQNRS